MDSQGAIKIQKTLTRNSSQKRTLQNKHETPKQQMSRKLKQLDQHIEIAREDLDNISPYFNAFSLKFKDQVSHLLQD